VRPTLQGETIMADSDVTPQASHEVPEGGGRERWPSRFSFIMAAIGSAVGLGNVWGFPKVAYANGGGAFFIPYFVALLTAGIPLLILEFSIGQMMQGSAPKALKKLNKNFEWVGWFALLVASVISVYYAVIMAYSWNYLVDSFSLAMPWSAGGEGTEDGYFYGRFLELSAAPGEWWRIRWPIVLGLAATWISVFLIIYKGVHRVGKIVLITVPLPWIILCVLALRGLTLEGASAGVEYYLRPDFEKLKDPATWLAAYAQIFFSLTIGFGVMIAYASYRPRKSDVTNNAFIVSFANCMTSFIAGFAVFSVLGFLAFKKGVPVENVVAGGPGLAFVAYPAAITKMGDLGAIWPPIIGILFFTALLTLGIDSLFSLVEALGAGFHDRFPKVKRVHLTAAFCGGGFLLGLFFCVRGGLALFDLFDYWTNKYGLVLVGLLQCLLVGYFFSTHRVRDFANDVSEIKLSGWWELCVKVITPLVLVYLLASKLVTEFETPYGASYPVWMQWSARAMFVALLAGAFAITRRWSYIALAGIALVVGLLTLAIVSPESADPEAKVVAVEGAKRTVEFKANFSGGDDAIARWDFGDGATSDVLNPTHAYEEPGTYEVSVSVRGNGGRGGAAKADLEVDARPFEVTKLEVTNKRSKRGVKRPLDFEYSAGADFGTEPYSYAWDFGDGAKAKGHKSKHAYEKKGTYKITLTATDSSKEPKTTTRETEVVAAPLAVDLRVDHAGGEAPAIVTFFATPHGVDGEKVDPEGLKFEWEFGDGEPLAGKGMAEASHRYDLSPEDEELVSKALQAWCGVEGSPGPEEWAKAISEAFAGRDSASLPTHEALRRLLNAMTDDMFRPAGEFYEKGQEPTGKRKEHVDRLLRHVLSRLAAYEAAGKDKKLLSGFPTARLAKVTVTSPDGGSVTESITIRLRPPEEHFPGRAALLAAMGGMLLIGGLALCILIAVKRHRAGLPGFEEEARG